MIKKGTVKTVISAYGNGRESVFREFFSKGWSLKSQVIPDYKTGDVYFYFTFEAGENAEEVILDLANAHIL